MGAGTPILDDRRLDTGNFYGRKLIRDGAAQSNYVTRRPGERHCPDCCQNFKHSGRQSLMVWGGIIGLQASELCQFPGSIKPVKSGQIRGSLRKSITSTDYIEQILLPFLLPWYQALERQGLRPIFMQDSAGIHGLKETLQ